MSGAYQNRMTKGARPFSIFLLSLCGAQGCAREATTEVQWPVPVPQLARAAPEPLPVRVASPFDPEAGTPQRTLPNRSVPEWAGERALPFADVVQRAAYYYQIPTELLYAVIQAESGFRSTVVSRTGATGLMQLMPRTAHSLGVSDSLNIEQNIFGGARYLRRLANRFDGDLQLILAGYNAGPGAVRKHGGVPPYPETRNYVRKVLNYYFRSRTSAGA